MSIKYVIAESGNVSAFVNGRPYYLTKEAENYWDIVTALSSNDVAMFTTLVGDLSYLSDYTQGFIDVDEDGNGTFEGVPLPSVLLDRVIDLVKQGYEFIPVLKFLHNLCENPSDHSIMELMEFLSNKNLPLTVDGCFLGYKAVRSDYLDKYSGTFDNSVGNVVSVERDQVDPNRANECSYGLHVGALNYVMNSYASSGDKIVIVKVNPKDVITVPRDYSFQKLRCCSYLVLADYQAPLDKAVYSDTDFAKDICAKTSEAVASIEQNEEVKPPAGWKQRIADRLRSIVSLFSNKG